MFYEKINIGSEEVTLCVCASVIPCFKNIFGEDFLKSVGKDPENMDLYMKMGFVMAKFAELGDRGAVNKLTENDYCDWLDRFQTGDIIQSVEKIATVFMREAKGSVKSKKN